jgi:hypothetical protein
VTANTFAKPTQADSTSRQQVDSKSCLTLPLAVPFYVSIPSDGQSNISSEGTGLYGHQEATAMFRSTLRFIPLLALLFAFSAVAKADSFQFTFAGTGSGTGQFTTDDF